MKILIVEYDKDISKAIVKVLKLENYQVEAVYDGLTALDYLTFDDYDGVILDLMMPKLDGISVVKEMRRNNNNTPVLILTAKSEIADKVIGLDAGADDYLTKPFSMKELLARVRAITRRKSNELKAFSYKDLTLNNQTYELFYHDKSVRLSSKEYQVMELLINNPKKLISTETLMDRVWGYDSEAEINVVWVYISALRKKLQNLGTNVVISAVRGVGYKLEELEVKDND